MPVFAMPIILMIESESASEAKKAIDEWSEAVDLNYDLPTGTEDIDVSPSYEYNDEGQRVLLLPPIEEVDEDSNEDTDDNDGDDFNDGEIDFNDEF